MTGFIFKLMQKKSFRDIKVWYKNKSTLIYFINVSIKREYCGIIFGSWFDDSSSIVQFSFEKYGRLLYNENFTECSIFLI